MEGLTVAIEGLAVITARTPLRDLEHTLPIVSLAMPTLMPKGLGDFSTPRQREITWRAWARHAIQQED